MKTPLVYAFVLAAACGSLYAQVSTSAARRFTTPGATTISTQGPRPTWGVGAGGANINLLSTRRFESWDAAPVPLPRFSPHPFPSGPGLRPALPEHPVAFQGSGLTSGLIVDGGYNSSNVSVGLHVGGGHHGPDFHHPSKGHADEPYPHEPRVIIYPVPIGNQWGGIYRTRGIWAQPGWSTPQSTNLVLGNGPLDARLFQTAPAVNASSNVAGSRRELTTLEVGVLSLQIGEAPRAVMALRSHLRDNPTDARAMRTLAIALVQERDLNEAGAVMRQAYRTDTKLATEPLSPASLGFNDRRFRELLTRSVTSAHRTNTASAWLLVSILMQSEGRSTPALAMLEKSTALGLETEVRDAIRAELTR